ncbi:hypothetical protein Lal_00017253 [Lupinus albus]|nr:hypothetical protein Lal_00017253 [Lupinus albus]
MAESVSSQDSISELAELKEQMKLFTYLMGQRIIAPIPGKIPENPGSWFDPNVSCAYHSGTIGHSIENCRSFKFKVQHLVDSKWLNFKQSMPNVSNNPLPNHGNPGVNATKDVRDETFLKDVSEIRTPMKVIFEEMCNQGMIEVVKENREGEECCEMHAALGHVIEDCAEFKMLLQKMMDMKLVVVGRRFASPEINVVGNNKEVTTFTPSLVRFEPVLNIPKASLMMTKVMLGKGYQPGKGLGKYEQGIQDIVLPVENKGRYGLGYNPTKADDLKVAEEAKRKRWARMGRFEYKTVKTLIPHIQQSFVSAGFELQGSVSMLEEERSRQLEDYVFQCTAGTILTNWVEIEAPSPVFWEDK